jgi:hypothetical protein
MSIASEDCLEDLDNLEDKIITRTKLMQKMMKSTEATILEDVIATRNPHNNGDVGTFFTIQSIPSMTIA